MLTLYLIAGIGLLVFGSDVLVRGASNLAKIFKISPLTIGLTVVAFGTSAPEAAVSVFSALKSHPDIAVGNIVGSNIFNVFVVLGCSALITPLVVTKQVIKTETPLMLAASILLIVLSLDGSLNKIESTVFLLLIFIYTGWTIFKSRKEQIKNLALNNQSPKHNAIVYVCFIIVGLIILVLGSKLVVYSASGIARYFGVNEMIIGITIVGAGTSLPELTTSIVAAVKKDTDIAIGNVIGSNIFNILFILGLSGIFSPINLPIDPSVLSFDFINIIATCLLCMTFFITGFKVDRWEGITFIALYVMYVLILIGTSKNSPVTASMKNIYIFILISVFLFSCFHALKQRKQLR
ncbi:MAG: calcium/sodium antiporter [bacterium]